MKVTGIKTRKVLPGDKDIYKLLDDYLPELKENSVVAITSKVVSIFEGRTIPVEGVDKTELIRSESDVYLPNESSEKVYVRNFTIVKDTYIPMSGIDESNANGHYVLWPKDPQKSANGIRDYLKKKHGLKHLGVIITDSTIFMSRWGTLGIAIGFSGFLPYEDYIGKEDLFGRILQLSTSNTAGGLAATAVMIMGEGNEQTPLVLMEDLPFIKFVDREPTKEEIDTYYISPLKDEAFGTFFSSANWLPGGGKNK